MIHLIGFFQKTDQKWDDVVPFAYFSAPYDQETNPNPTTDQRKVEQIFEHLWKPFIDKLMDCYGFTGVRIDFATCCELARSRSSELHPIMSFIQSINGTFIRLRPAPEIFWFEIFFSECRKYLYFIRHLDKGTESPTDIVDVNLTANEQFDEENEILDFLKGKGAEIHAERSDIQIFYVN